MKKEIYVKLNAKHPGVVEKDGILEVSVSAKPAEGEANKELVELLSDYFEVAKSAIEILHGHTSRHKIIEIRPWQKK